MNIASVYVVMDCILIIRVKSRRNVFAQKQKSSLALTATKEWQGLKENMASQAVTTISRTPSIVKNKSTAK